MKKYILVGLVLFLTSAVYSQTCQVQSLDIVSDRVNINIRGDIKPQYNSIVSSDGKEIIIRVFDCELSKIFPKPVPGGKPIYLKSVKVNQLLDFPTSIIEVMLGLKQPADFDLTTVGGSINVRLKAPEQKISDTKLVKRDHFDSGRDYYSIMDNLPNFPVSFAYRNAGVRDILNTLAARIGIDTIFSDDARGTITIDLNKVPFDEAFRAVLAMKELSAMQIGSKILRITTAATIKKEKEKAPFTTRFFPLKYQNAEETAKIIEDVIKAENRKGKVNVDLQSNGLIVTDIPSGIESIARLLSQIDKKPMQVLIEAKIVEVNINDGFDLGVEWNTYGGASSSIGKQSGFNFFGTGSTTNQALPLGPVTSGLTAPATSDTTLFKPLPNPASLGGTGVSFPSIPDALKIGALRFGRITDSYFLDMTISAAERKGKVKILSQPKVATLNNRKAKIDIKTEIPYTTVVISASTPPVETFQVTYIDTGIMLEVTPQVNADGRITMKIRPTVSQVASTVAPAEGGAPGVDTRSAETIVMTRNGETVVIGGLIYDINNDLVYKVPILGDIPILGWLFKTKHNSKQRIELLIFVTPKIIEG